MSKLTFYTSLKADLLTVEGVKYVGLWRNNLVREKEEIPNLFPAIYVELLQHSFVDLGNKAQVQNYDMTVRLHICFESYKDEDTAVLTLVDAVWQKMHKKQYGTFGELLRRNEEQNFDHDNVQDYTQDYTTKGRDVKTSTMVDVLVDPVINKLIIPVGGIGNFAIGQTFSNGTRSHSAKLC